MQGSSFELPMPKSAMNYQNVPETQQEPSAPNDTEIDVEDSLDNLVKNADILQQQEVAQES